MLLIYYIAIALTVDGDRVTGTFDSLQDCRQAVALARICTSVVRDIIDCKEMKAE